MTRPPARVYEESIIVEAAPEALYDLVSDITRTGEWSPICTGCWWDDEGEAGTVGAWFTGRNELPDRTWETRSRIVAADRGREFVWVVGNGFVRWGYTFEPAGEATKLTESWQFLPRGIEGFRQKYGDRAAAEIDERTGQAHDGIPRTLAAIKRIADAALRQGRAAQASAAQNGDARVFVDVEGSAFDESPVALVRGTERGGNPRGR